MYPKGHIGISLLVSIPIFLYLDSTLYGLIITLTVCGFSLFPDIDILNIYPANKIQHRGFTHTVWFGILVLLSTSLLIPVFQVFFTANWIAYALPIASMIGIVSHLLGDTINRSGIQPFCIKSYGSNISLNYYIVDSDDTLYNNILFVIGTISIVVLIFLNS